MWFNCKCRCSWEPARVVHGDGHVRSVARPVTVGELLHRHPHHFVCEPTSTAPLFHTGMLPLDMELDDGKLYLLLPLPRLLPHLASPTFPAPPCCCPCFAHTSPDHQNHHNSPSGKQHFTLRESYPAGQIRRLIRNSKLVRALVRVSKRIVIPERLRVMVISRMRFSNSARCFQKLENEALVMSKGCDTPDSPVVGGKAVQTTLQGCARNRWRPGLECISEVELLTGLLI